MSTNVSNEESQVNKAERKAKGEFVRGVSSARGTVEYPEVGRYHLIVAFNCPWCHRVTLARGVLGLQDVISMDVLLPVRTEADHPRGEGKWQFLPEGVTARNGEFVKFEECTADRVTGKATVVEIYEMCQLEQTSVPILFDKQAGVVVNNESSEIVRMLETVFRPLGTSPELDLYPLELQPAIDDWNALIYPAINNGAYKAGFSSNQKTYAEAFEHYFDTIDKIELALQNSPFLCGDQPTEADLRLFPTLFRHDPVYYMRMKLNKAFIAEYPNTWRWLSDFYKLSGVREASPLAHMTQGYFGRTGNNIVPLGQSDFLARLEDREYGARMQLARRLADGASSGLSPEDLLKLAEDLAKL